MTGNLSNGYPEKVFFNKKTNGVKGIMIRHKNKKVIANKGTLLGVGTIERRLEILRNLPF